MKIKYFITLLILYSLHTYAQKGHYVHLNVGGGLNNVSCKMQNGTNDKNWGLSGNLAYSFFFTEHFGLQTGVGVESYMTNTTLNYLSEIPSVDSDGESYIYRVGYQNWKEQQKFWMLEIPLMFQYKLSLNPRMNLWASMGAKMGLAFNGKYSTKGGSILTSGVYDRLNVELVNLPQYGFSRITNPYNGTLSFNKAFFASADLGCSYMLSQKIDLYFGVYSNCGLNSILKKKKAEVFENGGKYNGVYASNQLSKVTPSSYGLKIGLIFKLSEKKTTKMAVIDTVTDTDGDGVRNFWDKCPGTPKEAIGKVDSVGCPKDSDGDGVPDYLDKCPNTPKEAIGKVDSVGCPKDSDGDGVPDYLDKCPGTPKEAYGRVDSIGCPLDADNDGVPDYLDKCPGTPKEARGKVDATGCPLDTDNDGVPDYLDKCPTVKGILQNAGCPEIKKEVKALFKKALHGIQFETGKSTIKAVSFNLLTEIANVLILNPSYLIEVQGHTDNVGSKESNMLLSGRRADAVKTFLVAKGVEVNRMVAKGYGDTLPVATNKTSAGKALNRRVEFIVSFEKVISQ